MSLNAKESKLIPDDKRDNLLLIPQLLVCLCVDIRVQIEASFQCIFQHHELTSGYAEKKNANLRVIKLKIKNEIHGGCDCRVKK